MSGVSRVHPPACLGSLIELFISSGCMSLCQYRCLTRFLCYCRYRLMLVCSMRDMHGTKRE